MTVLDLRPAGRSALLATFDSLPQVAAFRAGLTATRLPGLTEVVSGARTLLLRYDPATTDAARLRGALERVVPSADADAASAADPLVIPVVYDGEDLDQVVALTGMRRDRVIAWHTGQLWTSAFCGFAPGFSYLTGTEPSLDLPRRSTSRTAVPSGAVALAGEFSAVYPRVSPGGWQLIGRTDVPMWSLDREPPALAPAGTRVRFVDAGAA
ncbi:KipI family sensor histidine kinase inhibitor [Curtobacterium sp. PhB172]|uniref:5-oxoprolinase subunit B family protein n=1 Tax=unclassified Curtobacterium TaxID=257496 RepID=UPI000F46DAD9|nr:MULTISPECIES: allophanate hydrolase subunit 1 [unclassified Curtobacterium]ROQ03948.1 KipI family sensor histidine kinase inhibitor [Curtobacterium sp. PhB171]ROQ19005.1 KipI family sensor histidine kinase inhibitor [Curtobacterium sp. PhB170]ROS32588.1 KipI family sensor histidine kinase inhibitor [Curtobacterium sp. PhB131]ROS58700.1 KipI family sensor histidine kinase inhibitor [Curtobacterium sp. PhB172]ROS63644.1 KipI family sensor histidine kinase inhibitor [Curtobacterium sp. PhB141]